MATEFDPVDDIENAPLVERRPLPDGFDPWHRAIVDRSEQGRERWARQVAQFGVEVTCETCGKKWVVHPRIAAATQGVYACSQPCRDKAFRKRKKDGPNRPLYDPPGRPWEHRKKAT